MYRGVSKFPKIWIIKYRKNRGALDAFRAFRSVNKSGKEGLTLDYTHWINMFKDNAFIARAEAVVTF